MLLTVRWSDPTQLTWTINELRGVSPHQCAQGISCVCLSAFGWQVILSPLHPLCWSHKGLRNHHQLRANLPFRLYILVEPFWSLYILCSTHICISDSSKYFYWHYRYTLLEQFLLSSLHSMSFLLWILQLPRDRQSLGYYCTEILKYLLKVIMVVRDRAQSRIQVPNSQASALPTHMKGSAIYRLRSLGQSPCLTSSISPSPSAGQGQCL